MAPAALDRIVSTCLEKDPDERWQTARDLRRELEWLSCSDPRVVKPAEAGRRWLGAAALVAAGTLVGVGVGAGVWRAPSTAPASIVLEVVPPPDTTLLTTASSIPAAQFALSADGRHLAFVAAGLDGRPALWLRALDSGPARRLAGTEGASLPFWAEDSRALAFFASGQLKRTDLEGSSPQGICSAIDSRGGTWNRDGVIVFAIGSGGLFRVNAGGGSPTPLTTPDAGRGEVSHRWPSFLPDGKHFLYTARGVQPGLLIGSLEGGPPTRVNDSAFAGVVRASRLFFIRNRALVTQPFDNERRQVSGEPVVLVPRVGTSSTGQNAFAITGDVLAYADDITSPGQLTWFDRAGRVVGTVGPVADHLDFELSPDARRLLVSRVDTERSTSDVWLVDLERHTDARLTTHPGIDASAQWDPSGSRVVFRSNREGLADAWIKNLSSGEAERLLFKGSASNPTSWSGEGVLLYNDSLPGTGWDVMQFEEARGATSPFIQTPFNELHGRFSPNGQWVAYSSDESGRWEVYVRPARGSGAPVTVSNTGGFEPRWRGDGKELFYLTPDRQVVAVELRTSGELHLGPRVPCFPRGSITCGPRSRCRTVIEKPTP
jgi:Tol biopolymer transport system component